MRVLLICFAICFACPSYGQSTYSTTCGKELTFQIGTVVRNHVMAPYTSLGVYSKWSNHISGLLGLGYSLFERPALASTLISKEHLGEAAIMLGVHPVSGLDQWDFAVGPGGAMIYSNIDYFELEHNQERTTFKNDGSLNLAYGGHAWVSKNFGLRWSGRLQAKYLRVVDGFEMFFGSIHIGYLM